MCVGLHAVYERNAGGEIAVHGLRPEDEATGRDPFRPRDSDMEHPARLFERDCAGGRDRCLDRPDPTDESRLAAELCLRCGNEEDVGHARLPLQKVCDPILLAATEAENRVPW